MIHWGLHSGATVPELLIQGGWTAKNEAMPLKYARQRSVLSLDMTKRVLERLAAGWRPPSDVHAGFSVKGALATPPVQSPVFAERVAVKRLEKKQAVKPRPGAAASGQPSVLPPGPTAAPPKSTLPPRAKAHGYVRHPVSGRIHAVVVGAGGAWATGCCRRRPMWEDWPGAPGFLTSLPASGGVLCRRRGCAWAAAD